MSGTARNFFILALAYGIVGMMLGLHMAMSQDHTQMPTHAHIMVLGWLMSAVFAFFYHLFPEIGRSLLARIHFALTAVAGVILLVTLYLFLAGNPAIEPVLGLASIAFFLGMVLFAWVARPALFGR
ncbi:MAG: hypothetical protein JNM20_19775 [Rhizobiales bacterium]|nr:hypothetical protein [Hyphomicrobiales bacterium]